MVGRRDRTQAGCFSAFHIASILFILSEYLSSETPGMPAVPRGLCTLCDEPKYVIGVSNASTKSSVRISN